MSDLSLNGLFGLSGKTALVTGASGGIGASLAIALAAAGAKVAVSGRRSDELERIREQIVQAGGEAVCLVADLMSNDACRKLIADAHGQLGRLDILVNCAGMNRRKPISEVTEDDYDTIMQVNLRSIYFLCQAAHPIMQKQGGGKIINVGSLTSSIGLGSTSVYGATKAAVAQLTKTMAVEWAKDNIQVNCLAPGFIITPLTEKSLWADEAKRNWLLGRIPAGRGGAPGDMAGVCVLLASRASDYLTGQMITIDGGVLAGGRWE